MILAAPPARDAATLLHDRAADLIEKARAGWKAGRYNWVEFDRRSELIQSAYRRDALALALAEGRPGYAADPAAKHAQPRLFVPRDHDEVEGE